MSAEAPKKRLRPGRRPPSGLAHLRLRPVTGSELGTLVGHRRAMFEAIGGFSAEDLDRADPRYRRWVRGRLANGRAEAVLAWLDGAAIGSAVIWYREDQPRPSSSALRVPYLMSVYVDPAYRGRGIATRLTEFLVARARTRGFPRVLLHASRFGRSVYARLGFERTWEMRWGGPYRSLPEGPERRRGRTFQGPGRRRSPRGRLR